MKHLFTSLFLLIAISAYSQTNIMVGGGLGFGSSIENLCFDLRGSANFSEQIDGAVSINIFLPDKESAGGFEASLSWWTINLDGHYLFSNTEQSKLYGLAGLNIANIGFETEIPSFFPGGGTQKIDGSDTEIGLNIGGGAEIPFGNLMGFGEAKYVVSDADQLVIVIGVLFNVGG